MHPAKFEPAIAARERSQTYALDSASVGPAIYEIQLSKMQN
jgi:hypothetical protein